MAITELVAAEHAQSMRNQLNHIETWEGPRAGDKLKHDNISPECAKQGNLVLFDVRKRDASQQGNDDLYLGEWDRYFEVGVVKKTLKTAEDGTEATDKSDWRLRCVMYEPWTPDEEGAPVEPVWVSIAKAKAKAASTGHVDKGLEIPLPKDNWATVVKYPWCAINNVPVAVVKAINPEATIPPRRLVEDYRGSGKSVVYLGSQNYWEYEHPLGNVRYVTQRDKSEMGRRGMKVMRWNEETQKRLLIEMRRTDENHRPWETRFHSIPSEGEDDGS